jgi:polyhydroxyalkanoate synthase
MNTAPIAMPAENAAPLDVLLVDAALSPVRRFVPDMSTAKWAVSLARKPGLTARRLSGLGAEAGRVLTGTSTVAPDRGDRRFTDVAWTENPLLKRLVQLYLAGGQTVEQLVIDADLDQRDRKRVQFLLENLIQATAPSNVPLVNPASA